MKRLLALMAACASLAFAQAPIRYSATTGDVVLSGSGTAFTIQQPAANAKQVTLESAQVYCSVACTVTQSQNGAAATATAGTSAAILPTLPAPAASATTWTASNVGGGTAAGGKLYVPATATVVLDLSQIKMGATGTGTNYSIVVSSITGTANITFTWSEK